MHETADPDRRTVTLAYAAELQAGLPARASLRQQRHEFVTQVLEYEAVATANQQQQQMEGAADQAAASEAEENTDPAAAAAADELQAEQLLKKQRIT